MNNEQYVIGPTPLLMGTLDRVQQEFNVTTYWISSDIKRKYPSYSMYNTGSEIITLYERVTSSLRGALRGAIL